MPKSIDKETKMMTLQEIADRVGISKSLLKKKIKLFSNLFQKNKRKRLYKPNESKAIINQLLRDI